MAAVIPTKTFTTAMIKELLLQLGEGVERHDGTNIPVGGVGRLAALYEQLDKAANELNDPTKKAKAQKRLDKVSAEAPALTQVFTMAASTVPGEKMTARVYAGMLGSLEEGQLAEVIKNDAVFVGVTQFVKGAALQKMLSPEAFWNLCRLMQAKHDTSSSHPSLFGYGVVSPALATSVLTFLQSLPSDAMNAILHHPGNLAGLLSLTHHQAAGTLDTSIASMFQLLTTKSCKIDAINDPTTKASHESLLLANAMAVANGEVSVPNPRFLTRQAAHNFLRHIATVDPAIYGALRLTSGAIGGSQATLRSGQTFFDQADAQLAIQQLGVTNPNDRLNTLGDDKLLQEILDILRSRRLGLPPSTPTTTTTTPATATTAPTTTTAPAAKPSAKAGPGPSAKAGPAPSAKPAAKPGPVAKAGRTPAAPTRPAPAAPRTSTTTPAAPASVATPANAPAAPTATPGAVLFSAGSGASPGANPSVGSSARTAAPVSGAGTGVNPARNLSSTPAVAVQPMMTARQLGSSSGRFMMENTKAPIVPHKSSRML